MTGPGVTTVYLSITDTTRPVKSTILEKNNEVNAENR
jgi:hypothetical protein